jgi:penicillin amidase
VAALGVALLTLVAATAGLTANASAASTSAPPVSAPPAHEVQVIRDEHGVPHVYADTARGLFYGDGWVTAQERLWQADLVRSNATGTLAALLGPGDGDANIGSDEFFRQYTGGKAHLTALVAGLDRVSRSAVDAFVEGLNGEIAQSEREGTLPVEYAATGSQPRPWTAEDVIASGTLSAYEVGAQGADEVNNDQVRQDLIARLGPAAGAATFADTHWLSDPSAPTTIPSEPRPTAGIAATAVSVASVPLTMHRVQVDPTVEAHVEALLLAVKRQSKAMGFGGPGHSNAIAVAGRLTASGQPLLLGGPQQGYTAPQAFMELGLHGAGVDVTGVTLPGVIGVLIGAGHSDAWSVTSGGDDNEDLYAETLDPVRHPGAYLFNGRWRRYACRTETIAVAGSAPVRFRACDSVHGPVLASDGTTAIAMRDATRDHYGATLKAFLAIDRASGVNQFLAAAKLAGTSLNFVYADTRGHIAYAHVGPVPVRPPSDNRFLPHPGDGTDEWLGVIPPDKLPTVVDPVQGWLANWNTKPRPGWTNSTDGFWQWGPVQRVQLLNRQLAAIAPHTATIATLERINRTSGQTVETPLGDAGSVAVPSLLAPMLSALDTSADTRFAAIKARLSGWNQQRVDTNNDGSYDNPAVTIFDAWYTAFVNQNLTRTLGDSYSVGGPEENVDANLVSRLLSGPNAANPLRYDYLNGTTMSQALSRSLGAALDALTTGYRTTDTAKWLTADLTITWNPYGAGSVPNTPWMNRGTYNQILRLDKTGPHGENVVAPGESGDVRSPFFADQLSLYATWQYKPMRLTRSEVLAHATSTEILTP